MSIIEFNNVTKYYGKHIGIIDATFKIKKGEIIIFRGHNGSGKTTTIKLILGLLKLKKRDNGTIKIKDDSIGYLPEKVMIPPFITGEEYINDMCFNLNSDAKELFDYFNLDYSKKVGECSKGMRQKIGITQLIASNKNILILDEPFSGLDSETQVKVKNKLSYLSKNGKTIIISTHLPEIFKDIKTKEFFFEDHKIYENV